MFCSNNINLSIKLSKHNLPKLLRLFLKVYVLKFHYWITTGRPELKGKISHFRPKKSLSWSQVWLLILNRKLVWFTILNCIWEVANKFKYLNLFSFKLILPKYFKVKALKICFFKERSWKSFGLPYFPQLLHHWGMNTPTWSIYSFACQSPGKKHE